MLDVLLVNPYVIRRHAPRMASYRPYPPLGLMYLGAVLRDRGFAVEIYDGTFEDRPDEITARLRRGPRPRVAGVYAMNSFRDDALATIERLKEHGILVIAGGPDPSIYDEKYLDDGADVVVRGEGEVALLALLDAFSIRPGESTPPVHPGDDAIMAISGASIIDDDVRFRRAPDRPASQSMDDLPMPAYDLVDIPRYLDEWRRVHGFASIQFMTSRGCPFSCTWCARPIFGRRYRQYGPERAVDEVEHLIKTYDIDHLWLFDDTFVVRRQWVEAFCDEIVERGLSVEWECLARTDLVDYGLLSKMRKAGCRRINFGFESGSQRVLDAMKKGTTVEDARRVAADMHRLGISMGGYVLFGYPGEEWADIEKTIELICAVAPVDYSTSVAYPMPGTAFYDLVHGMMLSDRDWASEDPDSVKWQTPYSPGFYRLVESLLHCEYDLALEFSARRLAKSKVLRAAITAMLVARDGSGRLERYRGEHFKGWQGLRKPEHSARHRAAHARRAAQAKPPLAEVRSLRVVQ